MRRGGARSVAIPALLAASSEIPIPNLSEAKLPDPVGVAEVPKRNTINASQIKTHKEALPCAGGSRLSRLPDARSQKWRAYRQANENNRFGTRTKQAIQAVRLINLLSRLARQRNDFFQATVKGS
jgi:hypothetical protein